MNKGDVKSYQIQENSEYGIIKEIVNRLWVQRSIVERETAQIIH